ncbi:hypothetical protein I4U23_029275 [Adineta vaga]|nr:hypothetical protein I4U23_029275 [Adineta vaga]
MTNDIPSLDSFQFHIPLTSTPKRVNKSSNCQPLSSTLSMSNVSYKQFELSISAITSTQRSSKLNYAKQTRIQYRRRNPIHPSTIIKRIELKYLLYSSRTTKQNKQRQYTEPDVKIYVV